MDRLILLVESRIRGDVYVRFGGELPKTHRSNTAGRWMLSLPVTEADYSRSTLKNVIAKYFNNSYLGVISSLVKEEEISVEELKELIESIDNRQSTIDD